MGAGKNNYVCVGIQIKPIYMDTCTGKETNLKTIYLIRKNMRIVDNFQDIRISKQINW